MRGFPAFKAFAAFPAPRPLGVPAPKAGRRANNRPRAEDRLPYPPPPATWDGPRTEWAVFWWLISHGWREGWDFYRQARIPGLGINISRDWSRADFLLVAGPGRRAGDAGPGIRGTILDPITAWTHPNASRDRLKRAVFARAGYRLVFIEGADLDLRLNEVMRQAIKGVDISSRSRSR